MWQGLTSWLSMPFEHDVVESLHAAVKFELELSRFFFTEIVWRFHSTHLVNPFRNVVETLIVAWKLWVVGESLLDISEWWQDLINWGNVKRKCVHCVHELCCDVEHSLSEIPVKLFTLIVGCFLLNEILCRLTMLKWVLFDELVKTDELWDRVRA